MRKDRLRLPREFKVDNDCMEFLLVYLSRHICTSAKINELNEKKIDILLTYPLKIIYNHKWYWTTIVKDKDNQHYWFLRPYNKSYFTTRAIKTETTSFDMVIQAVIDNEKM